jgi:hypothetical protein
MRQKLPENNYSSATTHTLGITYANFISFCQTGSGGYFYSLIDNKNMVKG